MILTVFNPALQITFHEEKSLHLFTSKQATNNYVPITEHLFFSPKSVPKTKQTKTNRAVFLHRKFSTQSGDMAFDL